MALELDKQLPYSKESEEAVLGSMLLDKDAVLRAVEILSENDFYKDSHRLIFIAMKDLERRGEAIDMVTLSEELRVKGDLDKVGGMAYIAGLGNMVPSAANIVNYANKVKDLSVLRRLIRITGEINLKCYEEQDNVTSLIGQAEQSIFELGQGKSRSGLVAVSDMMPGMLSQIESLSRRQEGIIGIPSFYKALDQVTSGWQDSDLIILAARPAMGKTAFALNLAESAAIRANAPVAIFSLEMSREQLLLRLISARAGIEQTSLRNGRLLADEWGKLIDAAAKLSQSPIYIDDTPAISVTELRSKARRLKAEKDLKMILVDYLQLMSSDSKNKGDSRQNEISEISRSLKALARELKIPVIALSQLSREVEKTNDKRPSLSHLRESGAIEQDADMVMFIFREEYYDRDTENKGVAEIIIAKHRNGPVGTVKLGFDERFTKFFNLYDGEKENK